MPASPEFPSQLHPDANDIIEIVGLRDFVRDDNSSDGGGQFLICFDRTLNNFSNIRFAELFLFFRDRNDLPSAAVFSNLFWQVVISDSSLYNDLCGYLESCGILIDFNDPDLVERKIPFLLLNPNLQSSIPSSLSANCGRLENLIEFCRFFTVFFSKFHDAHDSFVPPGLEHSFRHFQKYLELPEDLLPEAFASDRTVASVLNEILKLFPSADFRQLIKVADSARSSEECYVQSFFVLLQQNDELFSEYPESSNTSDAVRLKFQIVRDFCTLLQSVFLKRKFDYQPGVISHLLFLAKSVRKIEKALGPLPYDDFRKWKKIHSVNETAGEYLSRVMRSRGGDAEFGYIYRCLGDFPVAAQGRSSLLETLRETRAVAERYLRENAERFGPTHEMEALLPPGADVSESHVIGFDAIGVSRRAAAATDDPAESKSATDSESPGSLGAPDPATDSESPDPAAISFPQTSGFLSEGIRHSRSEFHPDVKRGLLRRKSALIFPKKPAHVQWPGMDIDHSDQSQFPFFVAVRPRNVEGRMVNLTGAIHTPTSVGFVEDISPGNAQVVPPEQLERLQNLCGVYVSDAHYIYAVMESSDNGQIQSVLGALHEWEKTSLSQESRPRDAVSLYPSGFAEFSGNIQFFLVFESSRHGFKTVQYYCSGEDSAKIMPLVYVFDKDLFRAVVDFSTDEKIRDFQVFGSGKLLSFEVSDDAIFVLPTDSVRRFLLQKNTDDCTRLDAAIQKTLSDGLPIPDIQKQYIAWMQRGNFSAGALLLTQAGAKPLKS